MSLISEQYRKEQEALHAKGGYGTASIGFADMVTELIDQTGAKSVLDYGCGRMCNLGRHISPGHDVEYIAYDPGVPEFAAPAEPADLVCCIDVLEHIEPDCLDDVLADLRRCVRGVGFFTVHTGPAVKLLSDGRNAHLIQQPPSWWLPKLMQTFDLRVFRAMQNGFLVVVK